MQKTTELQAEFRQIDPDWASKALEMRHPRQRDIRQHKVNEYADHLRRGSFPTTHQGIAFDKDWYLVDGQHRLMAIKKTGKTVVMLVTYGLEREAIASIDTPGSARRPNEAINMASLVKSKRLDIYDVAIIKSMMAGFSQRNVPAHPEQLAEFYKTHKTVIDKSRKFLPKNIARVISAATRAVVARSMYHGDEDRIKTFCTVLDSGLAAEPDQQPIVLLVRSLSGKTDLKNINVGNYLYARTSRALYLYLKKQNVQRLYAAEEELFPLPEEQAEAKGEGNGK